VSTYKELKPFKNINSFMTLRDLFKWASRKLETKVDVYNYSKEIIVDRLRTAEDRDVVLWCFDRVFGEHQGRNKKGNCNHDNKNDKKNIDFNHDKNNDFNNDDMNIYNHEFTDTGNFTHNSPLSKFIESLKIKHPALIQKVTHLIKLIINALNNSEPALLARETRIGKTRICKIIAEIYGQNLTSINLNSNTEASDCLGTFCLENSEITWRDGPPVTALISGDILLLDEINLA
ncbi:MAG: AAA family ATPase, partial [Planktothrix sp.]